MIQKEACSFFLLGFDHVLFSLADFSLHLFFQIIICYCEYKDFFWVLYVFLAYQGWSWTFQWKDGGGKEGKREFYKLEN